MKARIFNVDANTEQTCLRIERDDNGHDFVVISAWHEDEDGTLLYQENRMNFGEARNNFEMCEQYIDDFSQEAAETFYNSFEN